MLVLGAASFAVERSSSKRRGVEEGRGGEGEGLTSRHEVFASSVASGVPVGVMQGWDAIPAARHPVDKKQSTQVTQEPNTSSHALYLKTRVRLHPTLRRLPAD